MNSEINKSGLFSIRIFLRENLRTFLSFRENKFKTSESIVSSVRFKSIMKELNLEH